MPISVGEFEANFAQGIPFNNDGDSNFVIAGAENEMSDDKNMETNKSLEINSFNRLYYDGLQ